MVVQPGQMESMTAGLNMVHQMMAINSGARSMSEMEAAFVSCNYGEGPMYTTSTMQRKPGHL